ncbi:nitroreductase [Streptomyces sp. NBC_01707]|uniref:nitroreductase n=1 Tax=Streptomyces sp. NBC_01707 TaxID=2975914 RepID=UPI00352D2BAE
MLAQTLDDTMLVDLVSDATAAPSMHNAQPWHFDYKRSSRTLALRADFDRAMPEADPSTRALHVGCGAALLNLRVSAAHHGLSMVTALLPVPSDQALLASNQLSDSPQEPRDAVLVGLHRAIRDRHTSRYPFDARAIPEDIRLLLADAARAEGADFSFPTPTHLETVLELIRDAEGYDRGDPAREAEQHHWTRDTQAEAPVDGVPERVLLTATLQEVSASFATQPLEGPDLRWILRDPVFGTGHAQMIIRMGYGPAGPHTPRRPWAQVLTIEP